MLVFDYIKLGIGAIVGAVLMVGIMYLTVVPATYLKGRAAGTAAVVAEVSKRNAAAKETAQRAKTTIDECYAANGEWSQETGTCEVK